MQLRPFPPVFFRSMSNTGPYIRKFLGLGLRRRSSVCCRPRPATAAPATEIFVVLTKLFMGGAADFARFGNGQSGNSRRCWCSGLTSKTNHFWKRAFFCSSFGGVFVLLGWGVFLCVLSFFLLFARQREFLLVFFFEGIPHRNGEFPLWKWLAKMTKAR